MGEAKKKQNNNNNIKNTKSVGNGETGKWKKNQVYILERSLQSQCEDWNKREVENWEEDHLDKNSN